MRLSANEQQHPMILTLSEESVQLIIDYHEQGWAHEVMLDRSVWDMIAPIGWRNCPSKLRDLRNAVDNVPIDFGDDDDVQSLMSLAMLVDGMRPDSRLALFAEHWAALPQAQRADFWRWGTDKPIRAQALGTRSEGARLLDQHVPEWLPKLVETAEAFPFLAVGHPIHWTWAATPLGTTCIAWRDEDPNNNEGYVALSTCPVAFASAHDPGQSMARNAIDVLSIARDFVMASGDWRDELEWQPDGHDLLEVEETLHDWRSRLS